MFEIGYIITTLVVLYVTRELVRKYPPPIHGVYLQKGRWYTLKYAIFYTILCIRKLRRQNASRDKVSTGFGVKSKSSVEDMDAPQMFSDHPQAIDAIYFCGGNKDGYYITIATSRRPKHIVNGLFALRIPELGLLEMPAFPDTTVISPTGTGFNTEEITISVVKPMKEWTLAYKGEARLRETGVIHIIDLQMTWRATTKIFDFDTDFHPTPLCDAVARHPWSREYFDGLKSRHQTHYEQFGQMNCQLLFNTPENKKVCQKFSVDVFRDHSYGRYRDWNELHMFALHMMTLENGDTIEVGIVSMPTNISWFQIGYIHIKDGDTHPVSRVNLPIELLGEQENLQPPKNYTFSFVAGGKTYNVEVRNVDDTLFYYGENWEGKVYEYYSQFIVNGTRGWGIAQWMENYKKGRPDHITEEVNKRKARLNQ